MKKELEQNRLFLPVVTFNRMTNYVVRGGACTGSGAVPLKVAEDSDRFGTHSLVTQESFDGEDACRSLPVRLLKRIFSLTIWKTRNRPKNKQYTSLQFLHHKPCKSEKRENNRMATYWSQ